MFGLTNKFEIIFYDTGLELIDCWFVYKKMD